MFLKGVIMNAYEHLQKAKCRLIMKEPFYGSITMQMEFVSTQKISTMGVRIVNSGVIQALYNPEFITGLSLKQLYALFIHECEHIIRLHPVRIESRNYNGWNIAADMAINGKRSNPTCCYKEGSAPVVVSDDGCYIPEDWDSHKNTEYYYEKLPKCEECGEVVPWDNKTGQKQEEQEQEGQGQEQEGQGQGHRCPSCGQVKGACVTFDDHGVWSDSNISEDEARQIVKTITDQASSNCQGNIPGHLKEFLDELNKPVVRWREIIRRFLGKHSGGSRATYSRRNRRHNAFGIKGKSHHAVATLGVIVDTSGSIGSEDLKQFFAEIEMISSKTTVWVLQWDTAFGSYHPRYRRGDWKKIPITGRGGTRMNLSQEWVVENNIAAEAVIMLTDGYTYWRKEPMPMPFFVCLTTDNSETIPQYAEAIVMAPNQ